MKVVVLLTQPNHYEIWGAADDAHRERFYARLEAFDSAVAERGTVVAGEGLAHPGTARTLGPGSNGDRAVTDGPYAETAEQLGGFYVVDVPDLDTAVELARLLPDELTVELRPAVAG
ncbi:MAG TPA: YciI family protein [Luteimicrobium sp.]|uniref:YciI family protein n=1 Tax=Isoptericola variabilis TaxID=139208 RepID=UPI002BC01F80|nr:YciI family protein [Luteimicrobium sp.]HWV79644.1 YciI family protein [Isoptericola sp.]